MKGCISFIFFLCIISHYNCAAQAPCDTFPFQRIYYNQDYQQTRVKSIFFNQNSDMCFIGSVSKTTDVNTDVWMMLTTFHGTPLWSKAIGTTANDDIKGLRRTADGSFLMVGNTQYQSKYEVPWLAKIDAGGNPLWSIKLTGINGSLTQLAELDNGDIVAVGLLYLKFKGDDKGNVEDVYQTCNFIMRVDKDGKLLWQRSFYHSDKDRLSKVQQLNDGNLLCFGNPVDGETGYILKLDQNNGQLIWMNEYKTTNYAYGRAVENKDGSFRFKTGNRTYYLTSDGKFESGTTELNLLSNNISLKNISISDFGSPSPGNEIYFANLNPNPVLFNVNNGVVTWAYTYHSQNPKNLSIASGQVYKNNIYLTGGYNADKISDTSLNDNAAYLFKATLNGKTECADTFKIAFKISDVAPINNTYYDWMDAGTVSEEYIPLNSTTLIPKGVADCGQFTCCNDVTQNKYAAICYGNSYKLPDGNMVKTPGFYTSRFTTFKGCDSIIYTNISPAKKIDLNLNTDTCLINNTPVTYSLNNDTAFRYRWQDGATGNTYTITHPGKYWVTAATACDAKVDTVNVHATCDETVFIPSAFTPNNDGLNDAFRIPAMSGQQLSEMNIYNRLGQLIFHTNDAAKGWDGTINGTPQPAGTYIYFISYKDLSSKPHFLKGTVVIVR